MIRQVGLENPAVCEGLLGANDLRGTKTRALSREMDTEAGDNPTRPAMTMNTRTAEQWGLVCEAMPKHQAAMLAFAFVLTSARARISTFGTDGVIPWLQCQARYLGQNQSRPAEAGQELGNMRSPLKS
jgi:hypothetical protein